MAGAEKLALLESLYTKSKEDVADLSAQNDLLNEKVASQDIQLTDTQLALAEVYEMLIIKGKKTIDQVPSLIRDQVKEILIDMDLPELAE